MGLRQLVVFSVGGEEFGIDIDRVNIIEKMLEIFKIPNAPDYIEGLINLRGKVHTVFNLRKRFKLSSSEYDENTRIIMTETSSSIVGLIVDEVTKIIKVEDGDCEAPPKALSNMKDRFLSGIAKVDGKVILLLDVDKIVSAEE